jgi:hypothetical protein
MAFDSQKIALIGRRLVLFHVGLRCRVALFDYCVVRPERAISVANKQVHP